MALINHAKKEINAKIVYFGPAHSGKSTALTYIYSRIKPALRGELKNVPAGADELLCFDFSPFDAPLPNGYRFRLHIYTLTGTVSNPATWKMTLKGTDGIMIMLDPASGNSDENSQSVMQLREFLSAYGVGLHETPAVLQLNRSARANQPEDVLPLVAALDLPALSICHTNAALGEGLLEALTTLSRQVLDRITTLDEFSGAAVTPDEPSAGCEIQEVVPREAPALQGSQQSCNIPNVSLSQQEVTSEGATIRIPLEISLGDVQRRLVVTINVDLE